MAIIALGIAITLSNNLLSCSYHAYQAELFPTDIRARAVGFVYSFSRLSTIFTSFAIGACPPTRGKLLEQLGAP